MKRDDVYLHGFSKTEQNRLIKQAKRLENHVYSGIDLKNVKNLIEVGCGVGAQTEILLKRHRHLHITGVDMAHEQLGMAEQRLKKYIKQGRVELIQADAAKLSKIKKTFDGAFVCWFLEHVPDPLQVLKEIRKVLVRNGILYCTEVQNSSLFVDPYSPAVLKYWAEFNDYQWVTKRHPFVGTQLGNLLLHAGFKKITTEAHIFLADARDQKERVRFFEDYTELLLSAAPQLLEAKKITPALAKKVHNEMKAHTRNKNAILFDTWMRARAYK